MDITNINNHNRHYINGIISLDKFYETEKHIVNDRSIIVPNTDFFITHRDDLAGIVVSVKIDIHLMYKPKYASHIIYGTTEMWTSMLRLNNMRSIIEFDKEEILIYEPQQFKKFMNIFYRRKK